MFFSFATHRDDQTLIVTVGVSEGAESMLHEFERLAAGALRPSSQ